MKIEINVRYEDGSGEDRHVRVSDEMCCRCDQELDKILDTRLPKMVEAIVKSIRN